MLGGLNCSLVSAYEVVVRTSQTRDTAQVAVEFGSSVSSLNTCCLAYACS